MLIKLGEIMPQKIQSIDPQRYSSQLFELWSISAYDKGKPEKRFGYEIGSSKKSIQAGDVLLSRIIPHIRRVWIVKEGEEVQIGSGEWVIFRGENFFPNFLRHFLLSDEFHTQFMATVAGVGGSLLRARPEGIKRIQCFLPPLDEQRRIAGILDAAEALQAKRTRSLKLLDEMKQALFIDMFGDPRSSTTTKSMIKLGAICNPKQHKTIPVKNLAEEGFPVFGANGQIGFFNSFTHKEPTIAITCRGATCGTINITPEKCYITGNAMALDNLDNNKVALTYLETYLNLRGLEDVISGTAQPQITRAPLLNLDIWLPKIEEQRDYDDKLQRLYVVKDKHQTSQRNLSELFTSLQHKAFSGKLTGER